MGRREGWGWEGGKVGGWDGAGWERKVGGCEGVGDGRCEQGGERKRGTLASATALDRTPGLFRSSHSSLASVLGPLGSFSGSLAGSLQRSLGSWAIVAASSVLLASWLLATIASFSFTAVCMRRTSTKATAGQT